MRTYSALFPFCGLGAGALGFLQAQHEGARFLSLGGIDLDPVACQSFELLTCSSAWCVDIARLTPRQVRERYGERAPDAVFLSPPCKGSSKLTSQAVADTAKYREMNMLGWAWCQLMLAAWTTSRPRLILFENVPGITTRGKDMLERVRALLRSAGYVLSEGFHDCGVVGGLAQHRRRYLLVARHTGSVDQLLYQPPAQRVRGCGEVLGQLPLPGDEAAGPMHQLPKISWINWVRLSLIPAGGDWRDLPGVLEDGQPRREVFKRHGIESWSEPTGTVAGSGSNGVTNVADPRIPLGYETRPGTNRVTPWEDAAPTVTGQSGRPGHCSGGIVADPRAELALPCISNNPNRHHNKYQVRGWDKPTGTVISSTRPGSGAPSVADLRVKTAYDKGYAVLRWDEAAHTIATKTSPGCGAYAVADPRKPPPSPVVIVAKDGTWHRPMTTLELAALQGLPATINGKPLVLHGTGTQQREHIGNAVPVGAAQAIAAQMLRTLVAADEGALFLSCDPVWVAPTADEATP